MGTECPALAGPSARYVVVGLWPTMPWLHALVDHCWTYMVTTTWTYR